MDQYQVIIITIVLLFSGLVLAANNTVHSVIVRTLFFNSSLAKFLTRMMGILLVLSALILIIGEPYITFSIVCLVVFLFAYMIIRSKGKQKKMVLEKKEEILRTHQLEIAERKAKISALKNKMAQEKSSTKKISSYKKSMWNDGTLTNKELIEQFKSK